MADFEGVAAIRGARLADLSQHVADVLSVALAAGDEYVVGTLSLESYEFVPYALTGLAAAMQTPGAGEPRASTVVTVPIRDDKAGTGQAQRPVTLYGPGDVLGVDPGQVVRRYPSPGSVNAEETFHAHIEFDRPELPWTFSAQTPGNTMRPWLALVVLERGEVEWEPARAGLQPVMAVDADRLPPVAGAAAAPWAHAQVPKGPASLAARLSTAFAPVNVSRLLAARVLTQDTDYVACLVPTTDAGVKAGLGLPAGTLGAAWTPADGRVRLPVYDHWEFRTAPDGDFARLARRLVPLAAPWEIGRRILDTSRPGDPIADLPAGADGRRQVVRCALVSPNGPPPGAPADDAAWSAERTRALQDAVERAAVLEGNAGTDPGEVPDLPLVGPRLYAKGQRGAATMPVDDWFSELNTRPVNRVVAGLGTRVVQRDQEPLMQAAWAQVGEIDKANRALLLAQLARHTAASLHGRLAKLDPGRLLQVVRPVAPRLKVDGASLTLSGQTARSATPVAALGGGFRKALRAAGPVTRRLSVQESGSLARLVASADGARDFTRAYAQLDGIGGLSAAAIAGLDAVTVGQGLRIAPGEVVGTLTRASDVLVRNVGLATAVTTPDVWRAPDATFKVGEAIAQRVGRRIADHVPVDPVTDVVASRWLGGLAGGLATTRLPGTVTMNETALRLDASVMEVTERVHQVHAGPVVVGPVVRPGLAVRGRGAAMLRAGAALRAEPVRVAAAGVPFGLANLSGVARGRVTVPIDRPVAVGAAGGGVRAPLTEQERLERISTPQGRQLAAFVERADRVTVNEMRADLAGLVTGTGALDLAPTPVRDPLAVTRAALVTRLDPARTVVAATRARLVAGSRLPADWFADTLIRPIMAAPRFDRPMYQALDQYDREWLVPGLTTLKASELVTVLSTNDVFTESFLVGLSDEMARELLWRAYPTDMRGTYFHRFWDPTADELSRPIHRFRGTGLGTHVTTDPADRSGRAVVMIRGELVRRYPDLTVMALRETGAPDAEGRPRLPEAPTGPPDAVRSLFHAPLPPDILMAGLDITVDRLREDGWWIVLAEHPQATRFRRSERDLAGHEVRFGAVAAGATGATVAAARLENPTRIAFKAHDFLPSAG